MAAVAGFPYWELEFDENGRLVGATSAQQCIDEIKQKQIRDLFVFSHGWNNDHGDARHIYEQFFDVAGRLLRARGSDGVGMGVVGVLWPSILFPDDEPEAVAGGAASFDDAAGAGNAIAELKKVFPERTATLDRLEALLTEQPEDLDRLKEFQALLADLAPASSTDEGGIDGVLNGDVEEVFNEMSTLAPPDDRTDAAAFGDGFKKLWTGAKEALRVTSYWTMKERAGKVGEQGVGRFVADLQKAAGGVRVHLVGHSFGARVVSFSLKGLPASSTGGASPVKSLTLLQGAFSHFAFADALPHDTSRPGGLKSMAARVDGPILVTHSVHDLAVCKRYPEASIVSRDDAAAFDDLRFRFGAMGADGAQSVQAAAMSLKPAGQTYPLAKGKFLNLNGDDLITKGDPPSGAHSDIFHEEIAWAVLLGAGIVTAGQTV